MSPHLVNTHSIFNSKLGINVPKRSNFTYWHTEHLPAIGTR